VDVSNIGDRAGVEIVQLYVGYKGSAVDRPIRDLKAFARVALKPGETKTVSLELEAKGLAYYDMTLGAWKTEEIEYIVYVGPSSRQAELLSGSFEISG
jgi:beta-glucosidase